MLTESEYHENELYRHHAKLARLKSQDQRDKAAAMQEYAEMMGEPERLQNAVEMILSGNYGYGAMLDARGCADNPRRNRVAYLGQLAAALECGCPSDRARRAWGLLSEGGRKVADEAVEKAIESYSMTKTDEGEES
jgi:hypothetical protein